MGIQQILYCREIKHLGSGMNTQEVGETKRCGRVFLPTLLSCSSRFLRALQQNSTVKASLFVNCWSRVNGLNASRDRICPPGKLGNIVFTPISARAQISALPRISAHQLGQTSNKRPPRIRPPLNQFQISRETNKTWFYCQFIHNRKRQRDQQRIIVSLAYQLFLSPCACRVPLCVLSVLLNFCHIAALLANAVIFPGITRPFSSLRGPVISSIIELLWCVWRA